MKKRIIISMMIFGLSSVMSFANVLNDSIQNEETFIASTSEEDDAWIKIKDGKDEKSYRDFLAKFPNSQYAEQAASVVAMYDAVRLYETKLYEEACVQFKKAMVYNELSQDMMGIYQQSKHALEYKDICNGSLIEAQSYLQKHPNGIFATEASNIIAREMADNFDKYSYSDASAYAKDFSTYQYVKYKSNAFAISRADYSTDREGTLKWALDDTTKSYVENHISANERSRSRAYAWDDFWEDNFSLGVEFFSNDYSTNAFGFGVGTSFRIGKFHRSSYSGCEFSRFHFIIGAKWMKQQIYPDKKINGHHLIGSLQLRCNFSKEADYGTGYFGLGGEYSHKFKGDLDQGGAYAIGQIGFARRYFDIGLYYKHQVYKTNINEIYDDKFRIGISMTFYWMFKQMELWD